METAADEVEVEEEYVVVSGVLFFPKKDGSRGLDQFLPGSTVKMLPSRARRMPNSVTPKKVFDAEVYAEKVGAQARRDALAEANVSPRTLEPNGGIASHCLGETPVTTTTVSPEKLRGRPKSETSSE